MPPNDKIRNRLVANPILIDSATMSDRSRRIELCDASLML